MSGYKGWGAIGGHEAGYYACKVNSADYRIRAVANGWSLSTWLTEQRYWHFLGEFATPGEATERVNAIEAFADTAND